MFKWTLQSDRPLRTTCSASSDKIFLAIELCLSITVFVLFTYEFADDFREAIWANGGANGWNSDPAKRIYFYANSQEPPEIPLIWTQSKTDANLALAILTVVCVIVRAVATNLHYLPDTLSALYDVGLLILWAVSLAAQNSGDFSDPEHPSEHPWYLDRSCIDSWIETRTACRVLQVSFVASLLLACVYGLRILLWGVQFLDRGRGFPNAYRTIYDQVPTLGDGFEDSNEYELERRVYQEALSPVLAFFPESPRQY